MLGNEDFTPAIIKRPSYPGGRNPYKPGRAKFSWDGSQWGPVAKTALAMWCEHRKVGYTNLFSSYYARYGITAATTYAFLQRAVPQLFEEYEQKMGKPMARDLPIKRVYMWWLNAQADGGCNREMTTEHPFRKTPYLVPQAEALVRKAG